MPARAPCNCVRSSDGLAVVRVFEGDALRYRPHGQRDSESCLRALPFPTVGVWARLTPSRLARYGFRAPNGRLHRGIEFLRIATYVDKCLDALGLQLGSRVSVHCLTTDLADAEWLVGTGLIRACA